MDKSSLHGCIGNSIRNRASALATFLTAQNEAAKYDVTSKNELMKIAPLSLTDWLTEEEVLDNLFVYGRYSTKIIWGEYGFITFKTVKDQMKQLSKAWEDIVSITVRDPEPHRVEVDLRAIM